MGRGKEGFIEGITERQGFKFHIRRVCVRELWRMWIKFKKDFPPPLSLPRKVIFYEIGASTASFRVFITGTIKCRISLKKKRSELMRFRSVQKDMHYGKKNVRERSAFLSRPLSRTAKRKARQSKAPTFVFLMPPEAPCFLLLDRVSRFFCFFSSHSSSFYSF